MMAGRARWLPPPGHLTLDSGASETRFSTTISRSRIVALDFQSLTHLFVPLISALIGSVLAFRSIENCVHSALTFLKLSVEPNVYR